MESPSPSKLDSEFSLSPLPESSRGKVDEGVPEAFRIAQRNALTYSDLKLFLKKSSMTVFMYGSLQLPSEIALCLNRDKCIHDDEDVGLALRMTPAVLPHHRVYAIKDRIFPALLDDGTEKDVAEGMVIFGLTEAERQRFDRREGGWYSREQRAVFIRMATGDEQVVGAHVYIWAQGSEHLIDRDEKQWSLEEFVQERQKDPVAQPSDKQDQAAFEKSMEERQERFALDEERKEKIRAHAQRCRQKMLADYEKRKQRQRAAYALRQQRMAEAVRAIEADRERRRQQEHRYEDSSSDSFSPDEEADPPSEAEDPFKGFDGPSHEEEPVEIVSRFPRTMDG